MRRRLSPLPIVLLVVLGLAACGSSGSSGTSPASYVRAICNAVGPFEKSVQARSAALNPSIKSAAEGKSMLQAFLGAVSADVDKVIGQLKAAGTPSVPNGKKIADAVTGAFTQLKAAVAQAASQAAALPTTSPAAFKAAAQALGASVRASMANISSGLTGLQSPDLEKAAKKEPSCGGLSSG